MSKTTKNLKNPKIFLFYTFLFKKIIKKLKFSKSNMFSINLKRVKILFFAKKISAVILFLPFWEISLQPELSKPPSFRIQGGLSEREGAQTEEEEDGNSCV